MWLWQELMVFFIKRESKSGAVLKDKMNCIYLCLNSIYSINSNFNKVTSRTSDATKKPLWKSSSYCRWWVCKTISKRNLVERERCSDAFCLPFFFVFFPSVLYKEWEGFLWSWFNQALIESSTTATNRSIILVFVCLSVCLSMRIPLCMYIPGGFCPVLQTYRERNNILHVQLDHKHF